jgi:hypothetical protein
VVAEGGREDATAEAALLEDVVPTLEGRDACPFEVAGVDGDRVSGDDLLQPVVQAPTMMVTTGPIAETSRSPGLASYEATLDACLRGPGS